MSSLIPTSSASTRTSVIVTDEASLAAPGATGQDSFDTHLARTSAALESTSASSTPARDDAKATQNEPNLAEQLAQIDTLLGRDSAQTPAAARLTQLLVNQLAPISDARAVTDAAHSHHLLTITATPAPVPTDTTPAPASNVAALLAHSVTGAAGTLPATHGQPLLDGAEASRAQTLLTNMGFAHLTARQTPLGEAQLSAGKIDLNSVSQEPDHTRDPAALQRTGEWLESRGAQPTAARESLAAQSLQVFNARAQADLLSLSASTMPAISALAGAVPSAQLTSFASLETSAARLESLQHAAFEQSTRLSESARLGAQITQQLRQQVITQINQQQQQATIRLDPPELGALEIFLQHDNGRLQITISAAHSDVARALQQSSERLRHELTHQAMVEVSVDIAHDQSGQRHQAPRALENFDEVHESRAPNAQLAQVETRRRAHPDSDLLVTV